MTEYRQHKTNHSGAILLFSTKRFTIKLAIFYWQLPEPHQDGQDVDPLVLEPAELVERGVAHLEEKSNFKLSTSLKFANAL